MKKLLKFLFYIIIFSFLTILILLIHGYYKTHIYIDDKYMIIDDKTGYSIISKTDSVLTSSPIVWFCVSKKYILGCGGESLWDKPESYRPTCLKNRYFIVNKNTEESNQTINEKEFNFFIKTQNINCEIEYLY